MLGSWMVWKENVERKQDLVDNKEKIGRCKNLQNAAGQDHGGKSGVNNNF